jgi:hypothetical protein
MKYITLAAQISNMLRSIETASFFILLIKHTKIFQIYVEDKKTAYAEYKTKHWEETWVRTESSEIRSNKEPIFIKNLTE